MYTFDQKFKLTYEIVNVSFKFWQFLGNFTWLIYFVLYEFWNSLGSVIMKIPRSETEWLGADLNGHVKEGNHGAAEVMGRYGVGVRNSEGDRIVDFATVNQLAIANTFFKKRTSRRSTYTSGGRNMQVDYILCWRADLQNVQDFKVLPKEAIAKQHKLTVCKEELQIKGRQTEAE